jgi:hypothetical protein
MLTGLPPWTACTTSPHYRLISCSFSNKEVYHAVDLPASQFLRMTFQ